MKISWHCRACDKQGEAEISIEQVTKSRKSEDLLTLLGLFVRRTVHDTCKGDIGVKLIVGEKTK